MATKMRLSVRTGVVGAWTAMVGFVIVVIVDRLVSVVDDGVVVPPLTTAGVPIASAITAILVGLYNGGSVSVFVGLLLMLVGWYQVLAIT